LDSQRLFASSDLQLEITPRTPSKRHERPTPAAIRQKLIENTDDVLAGDLVSIALFALVIHERLGISEANIALSTTTYCQLRISSGQIRFIQQQRCFRVCRYV